METDRAWEAFEKSGKIKDYLAYRMLADSIPQKEKDGAVQNAWDRAERAELQ